MSESMDRARALVRGLITAGVRDVVLCPGSRSAPLAYSVAEAEAAGAIRLHVRSDERTAGFLALGLGIGDPTRPAVVVTTSGTAVANLHPAVLEAHHARVPLIVLTADRPLHLHGTWASQTTGHQARMFGEAAYYQDGSDPQAVVAAALGVGEGPAGTVHVNLGLDDPLYLDGDPSTDYPRPGAPPVRDVLPEVVIDRGPRTVVVAGDRAGAAARILAEQAGWPLFAEPSSGALPSVNAIPGYRLLDLSAVERAVVLGRPTLSRPITRLLNDPGVEVVHAVEDASVPGPGRAYRQLLGMPVVEGRPSQQELEWLRHWQSEGSRARTVIREQVSTLPSQTGPQVAADLVGRVPSGEALVIASSNAIRDVDLGAHGLAEDVLVVANRGLAGIDGTISTAFGVAIASGRRTHLLIGDLAFLHDLNALNIPPGESRPNVEITVVNDAGGAIFSTLEYSARADFFERVFGTPHTVDLTGAAAAHGFSITEVRTDRAWVREFHDRLKAGVGGSIPGSGRS